MTVHWHQNLVCPHCFSTATADFSLERGRQNPETGDAFLCSFCAEPSIYDDKLELRMPTREELDQLTDSEGYAEARSLLNRRRG